MTTISIAEYAPPAPACAPTWSSRNVPAFVPTPYYSSGPIANENPDMVELVRKNWGINGFSIPTDQIDEEIMRIFVTLFPIDINRLPLDKIDPKVADFGIKLALTIVLNDRQYSPHWYQNIFMKLPQKLMSKELCEDAFLVDRDMATFMPEERWSYDMALIMSTTQKENPVGSSLSSVYNYLSKVPMKYRTIDVCRNYLHLSGTNIESVPRELVTQELCDMAFQQNANSISYIPIEYRTYEMCLAAATEVSVFRESLPSKIPPQYLTKEFWDAYHLRGCKLGRPTE